MSPFSYPHFFAFHMHDWYAKQNQTAPQKKKSNQTTICHAVESSAHAISAAKTSTAESNPIIWNLCPWPSFPVVPLCWQIGEDWSIDDHHHRDKGRCEKEIRSLKSARQSKTLSQQHPTAACTFAPAASANTFAVIRVLGARADAAKLPRCGMSVRVPRRYDTA